MRYFSGLWLTLLYHSLGVFLQLLE